MFAGRQTCTNKINQTYLTTLHTGHIKSLLFAALSIIFVSCENSSLSHDPSEGKGLVMVGLYPEIDIKGVESVSAGVDDYNIRFVGVGDYVTSQYYRYGNMTWPMEWYFGIFRLQAESCTAEQAETLRGQLRYEGLSAPFSVINGQTATVAVTCTVANFQVKVNFDDSMYEAFDDYVLTVSSVSAPPADEDDQEDFVPQTHRTLDFTPFEQYGYYNLPQEEVILEYVLSVKTDGAELFVPVAEGYFTAGEEVEPTVVNAGDIITFNVRYTGPIIITDGVKFIVDGERTTVHTGLELEDYKDGTVTEDE